jgi:geranylgeranyl diphosphate synthase type II
LKKYGQNLGLAFQIVDDLLDLCGNQAKIGKRTGSDLGQGKLTYPELLGVEDSRTHADALIQQAISAVKIFGSDAEPLNRLARYVIERNR